MPKQIFEITSFDGIDLSVSSEDTSNQAAFDVLNIDNARSLGNLTPIKNDTFLSRAGFTISKTSTGIDDDVYIIGMETINWHNDQANFTGPTRKISFSLGLSNSNEYEGGDLVIKTSFKENHYKLDRGDIIVFPSWVLHKVTSVTKGKRRVVVGWGEGISV